MSYTMDKAATYTRELRARAQIVVVNSTSGELFLNMRAPYHAWEQLAEAEGFGVVSADEAARVRAIIQEVAR